MADVLGDDSTEPRSLDDETAVDFLADLSDDGSNVFAFSIAIRPDHEVCCASCFSDEIGLDSEVVFVLSRRRVSRSQEER
jgi:hypothetical protein